MAGQPRDFSAGFPRACCWNVISSSVVVSPSINPPRNVCLLPSRPLPLPLVETSPSLSCLGIVVQLAGSKTWVLYDEMVPFPRPDLKYKPASADLGEPIAVLELHPGDMMYIPRWARLRRERGNSERR